MARIAALANELDEAKAQNIATPCDPGTLKPCPFCGVASELETDDVTTESFAVWCKNCGSMGPQAIARDSAVECWNSRAR
jgi:Lar family restriction alleviation protein